MYIIFDSNIWLSELGLNSSQGSAIKFFIKKERAILVVPEVIRLETERNLRNALNQYTSDIKKNYRQLLAIFGQLKEIVLPDEAAVNSKVESIFGELGIEVLKIPLSLESMRSSFLKTIDKVAPSDKNQEFKDGVIWADCLQLLKNDDVYFVTGDKAFYKNRDYNCGLAEALANEAVLYPHKIQLFSTISELLKSIRVEHGLDRFELAKAFVEDNQRSIENILSTSGFSLINQPQVTAAVHSTEDPNKLYIKFKIIYDCEDLALEGRTDAFLSLEGDGSYHVDEKKFLEMRNFGEELLFKEKDGEKKRVKNIVLFAQDLVIGHRTEKYSVTHILN